MTLIERFLSFTNKFLDKINDKIQLQRFLGSLNYVIEYFPNIIGLAKPLRNMLKTNHISWSDTYTNHVHQIKKKTSTDYPSGKEWSQGLKTL